MCGLVGGAGFVALALAIFQQLRRIDSVAAPLAYFQLGTGIIAAVFAAIFPWLAWSRLVYRTDTLSPDVAQAFTDLGMFTFFLPWPTIWAAYSVMKNKPTP
jgi:hypothetical protein